MDGQIIEIKIKNDSMMQVQKIETLLQIAVQKIDHTDFIKLLEKANQNPSIVKTALRFI